MSPVSPLPAWLNELKNWNTLPGKTVLGYQVAKDKAYPRLIKIAEVAHKKILGCVTCRGEGKQTIARHSDGPCWDCYDLRNVFEIPLFKDLRGQEKRVTREPRRGKGL